MLQKIKEFLAAKWWVGISGIVTILMFLHSIFNSNDTKGIDPNITATIATVLVIFLLCYVLGEILDVLKKIWIGFAILIPVIVLFVSIDMETRDREINFGETNNHCQDPKDVRWSIRADEGWEIDVTSIRVKPTTSEKSTYSGIKDKTKDGFDIEGKIANNGNCIEALGQVVAKDARGSLHVSGTYKETRLQVRSYLSFFK